MTDRDEMPQDEMPQDEAEQPAFDKIELKRAMKAFRKRLKLMRLDDESGLGGRQLTGGRQSGIAAIVPPDQFRAEVWEELARQGRLKKAGRGMYQLPDEIH